MGSCCTVVGPCRRTGSSRRIPMLVLGVILSPSYLTFRYRAYTRRLAIVQIDDLKPKNARADRLGTCCLSLRRGGALHNAALSLFGFAGFICGPFFVIEFAFSGAFAFGEIASFLHVISPTFYSTSCCAASAASLHLRICIRVLCHTLLFG